MSLWYTNAHQNYDYSYVETIAVNCGPDKKWRMIRVSDEARFAGYQRPRYASGGCVAFPTESEEAEIHGLGPTLNDVLGTLGYTTHDESHGVKSILGEGSFIVFQGRAGEVWDWLTENGKMAEYKTAREASV
jgi:hypothetical protein